VSDWTGKHVLVTGGSSGIGLATAEAFASRGADVTLVARDPQRLEIAREAVAARGAGKTGKLPETGTAATAAASLVVAALALALRPGTARTAGVTASGQPPPPRAACLAALRTALASAREPTTTFETSDGATGIAAVERAEDAVRWIALRSHASMHAPHWLQACQSTRM